MQTYSEHILLRGLHLFIKIYYLFKILFTITLSVESHMDNIQTIIIQTFCAVTKFAPHLNIVSLQVGPRLTR